MMKRETNLEKDNGMQFVNKIILLQLLLFFSFVIIFVDISCGQEKYKIICDELKIVQDSQEELDWQEDTMHIQSIVDSTIAWGDIFFDPNKEINHLQLPAVFQLLQPTLNGKENLLFRYVLFHFLAHERFEKDRIQTKQIICSLLLNMLNNKAYTKHYDDIIEALLGYFDNSAFYAPDDLKMLENLCIGNFANNHVSILLLPILILNTSDKSIFSGKFINNMKETAELCQEYDNKNLIPFLALMFMVNSNKTDNQWIAKLQTIFRSELQSTKNDKIKNKTILPYKQYLNMVTLIALIHKQEIIDILKEGVNFDDYTDNGIDVIPRYSGIAYFSMCALKVLLKDFPDFSNKQFYLENGRIKCIEWLKITNSFKLQNLNIFRISSKSSIEVTILRMALPI